MNILDNNALLHGCDYNPDQWLDRPDILEEDIRLMKIAKINCVSLGIFAWSTLEPQDGIYNFKWLEQLINRLYEEGIYTILSTPSGARPVWMAKKNPEVLRVNNRLVRNKFGARHNHCYTSPYYRQKISDMNERLSKEFGNHPAVILWHISNEYGGECYCDLCQDAFRIWLKEKYQSIDKLNHEWWTAFWSHVYDDFDDIEAPVPDGEMLVHGLSVDWRRFITKQTAEFCQVEIDAIRKGGSTLPTTINMMDFFDGLNYFKFKDIIDITSWDSYPDWHLHDDIKTASRAAMFHDILRSIKQQPFLLMESTPSNVNWKKISPLKKPGMHKLSSLQAVAHGSNSVQYFQWRKSRGCSEKYHGSVVSHDGTEHTRTFKDVESVGNWLSTNHPVSKSMNKSQVAMIYDWENRWAIQESWGPRKDDINYTNTQLAHYRGLWKQGISVDVIDMECDLSEYKVIIAPLLYMHRGNISDKLGEFVKNGGTLIGTYLNGVVNENDLCYLGQTPHNLVDVYGLYTEDIDSLPLNKYNSVTYKDKTYDIHPLCELTHTTTATVLASYNDDFYAGSPVLTKNTLGKGTAYYIAAEVDEQFYYDLYKDILDELQIEKALDSELPNGVVATKRSGESSYIFVQNYTNHTQEIILNTPMKNLETGELYKDKLNIENYGFITLVNA